MSACESWFNPALRLLGALSMLILLSEVYLRSRGWASDAAGAELNPSPREGGGCGEMLLLPFPRARGRSTVSQQMPVPTVGLSLY